MSYAILQRMILNVVMRSLEYRGFFATLMFERILSPLIGLLILLRLHEEGANLPYDRGQLIGYYGMLSIASMITGHWVAEYVAEEIRNGGLSPFLLRPMPYISVWVSDAIGQKILMFALLLPQVAIYGLLFWQELSLPTEFWLWCLFGISLLLATGLAFLLQFAIGLLAFWVEDIGGIRRLEAVLNTLFSGSLLPLTFFPAWIHPVLTIQPYRYTLSFPLEILTTKFNNHELIQGFELQLGYVVLLYLLYRYLWRSGVRRYAASGA